MVILKNNKNENFKCQNLNGKYFICDSLPRNRKPFFKILPDFHHRSDQIYHIWKSPLDDPLIILPSICIIGHRDSLLVCAACQLNLFKDLVHNKLHVSPNSQDDMFLVHGTNTRSNLARNANPCIILEIRLL